ncbi:MAG TPA: FADH(2)-oxidizing methylenetetrahydrofolate--tRNA-(uracil(54)-C(5))-methyltransferase TrmFO, partial [Thermoanaerobaculia bacterium]
ERPPGAPYAPTNVNFGLLPPIDLSDLKRSARKDEKRRRLVARALADFDAWLARIPSRSAA